MWEAIGRRVERLRESPSLFLVHHPTCEYYDHHTMEVSGIDLCMGCFVVYPVAGLSLLALSAAEVATPVLAGTGTVAFWLAGVALVAPMLTYKLLHRRGSESLFEVLYRVGRGDHRAGRQRLRVATKALLAVGLACFAFPIAFRPAHRVVGAVLFAGFLVTYVGYKGATALDDCQGCPQRGDFPNCSGMDFDEE